MKRVAFLMGLCTLGACYDAKPEADVVSEMLTRAVAFDLGRRLDGPVPKATRPGITLRSESALRMSPGGVSLMPFGLSSPPEGDEVEATVVAFGKSQEHFEIETSSADLDETGTVSHRFTLTDEVCDSLCDRLHTLTAHRAFRLRSGVSAHADITVELDCRERGNPARCDDEGGSPVVPRDGGGGAGGDGGSITEPVEHPPVDKIDLLFMVDNSGSMREEQAALRAQFENMVQVLTTGDRDKDGNADFPPVTDLHLAVVSSDMGLTGITGIPNCDNFGDDGVMQTAGNTALAGCQSGYPPFIAYTAGMNSTQTAQDFACVSALGTEGCGFEQQLEATLKALWPAQDRGGNGAMDPNSPVMTPNRVSFVGDAVTGVGTTGHGDGMNVGFLRNDPTVGLSLIAVVVVTDEEDCSSRDLRHFTPPQFLDPTDPLAMQDLNLRCFFNPDNLYDVQRYVDGLQALRPDWPQLVTFSAIVGVPPDLVDATARAGVDFDDDVAREAYYQGVLGDPRMQEVPDPTRTPEQGGNLTPSCAVDNNGDGTVDSRAYPPRRIVEVARRFGANGVVQSICQNDFAPAIDAIVEVIAKQLSAGRTSAQQ